MGDIKEKELKIEVSDQEDVKVIKAKALLNKTYMKMVDHQGKMAKAMSMVVDNQIELNNRQLHAQEVEFYQNMVLENILVSLVESEVVKKPEGYDIWKKSLDEAKKKKAENRKKEAETKVIQQMVENKVKEIDQDAQKKVSTNLEGIKNEEDIKKAIKEYKE